ncbi:unnamed protein product [Litomosoides sigmodontis]|uniref:Uncharacterized protein n=1 Tax=Litomosoides sigmodontis TaxID=42156 RepID=A0A3P6VCF1_LITSI|nr:unnamed protein product [Litomosoides sigmodontis]
MFLVPNCQPATELYGLLDVKLHRGAEKLQTTEALEHRLHLLGVKNSIVQENVDVKTTSEANNSNRQITTVAHSFPFKPKKFEQIKLEENEMIKKKCSIRSWLWQQYLSQHGNCSLCERPLNGLHEFYQRQ